MTDKRIKRPNYSSDLMECSECSQTYDERYGECPACNPPGFVSLSPLDELTKRLDELTKRTEILEQMCSEQRSEQLETNLIVIKELKSAWGQMEHIHRCLAAVEVRLGIKPTIGDELKEKE